MDSVTERLKLTCAVSGVPRPQQSAGLLILSLSLSVMVAVVGESVDALVAAGVAVCVVDDHVVQGDRQVNPQLVTGEAPLGLGGAEDSQVMQGIHESCNKPCPWSERCRVHFIDHHVQSEYIYEGGLHIRTHTSQWNRKLPLNPSFSDSMNGCFTLPQFGRTGTDCN